MGLWQCFDIVWQSFAVFLGDNFSFKIESCEPRTLYSACKITIYST
jgi:hypothetical protein